MNLDLGPLFQSLSSLRPAGCVLATVLETAGSSYRKAGAMMLLHADGPHVGLVSGGCLEADLAAHARDVAGSGIAREVSYDLTLDDDTLWGLGLGCGGRIRVLLERADNDNAYAGLATVEPHWRAGRFCWLARHVAAAGNGGGRATRHAVFAPGDAPGIDWLDVDVDVDAALQPRDRASLFRHTASRHGDDEVRSGATLLIPVMPPPILTVCGAGSDALPLVQFARASGWRVQVFDHRPSVADASRFDDDVEVHCAPAANFECTDTHPAGHAAVIMSHHLQHDASYLRALLASPVQYIGLLGPVARRQQVLTEAQSTGDGRLYGPAGFDIGADLPQSIALSILAEAHAVLSGMCGPRG